MNAFTEQEKAAITAEEAALNEKMRTSFLTFEQCTRRMKLQRQRQLADEQTEHHAEGRRLRMADKLLIHGIE